MEESPLNIQDAVSEAERLLVGRRSTIATHRPSVARKIPTHRLSSIAVPSRLGSTTGLDIDLHDLKHLLLLDKELERDEERRSLLHREPPEDKERCERVLKRMRLLIVIAALGGFLSGYNTGVLSGVLLPLTDVFMLSAEQKELIVSSTIFFAFLSSIYGGSINQRFGRKPTIMSAAAVFVLGALVLLLAQNYFMVVFGEVLLGIGIGIESLTSPMYIAEVAKPSIRGMLVSAYALLMCFGQFFAGVIDGVLAPYPMGWRFMLGMAAVPGTVMFCGFLLLPESPSWLLAKGKDTRAEAILMEIRDTDEDVQEEILEIQDDLAKCHTADYSESSLALLSGMMQDRATRNALLVGCSLMALQQWCGVNAVLYYAASIYQMAGFAQLTSIWLSAFTSLAQIIGLALSVLLVETAGRRPLILTSLASVTVSVIGLGFAFYLARVDSYAVNDSVRECSHQPAWGWSGMTQYCFDCVRMEGCGYCNDQCVSGDELGPFHPDICSSDSFKYESCPNPYGYLSVFFMVIFLITFGIGMAGLPWTVNSEIYPIQYRSLAVSISTATNWMCNLLISSTFLTLSERLTSHRAFWLYGIISGLGVIWLYYKLPETKGKTLEEIHNAFGGHSTTQQTSGQTQMVGKTNEHENNKTSTTYNSIN